MVGRLRVIRSIGVIVLIVVATACSTGGSDGTASPSVPTEATDAEPATADDLIGIWVREGAGRPFLRFEEDGTFAGDNYGERLYADPQARRDV